MESFRIFFLLIFLCSQIFCFEDEVLSSEEDPWTTPSLKAEGLKSSSFQRFAQLVKRGKFQQFYGLMGKRATGHPGEKFIGLMGRRYSAEPSLRETAHLEKPSHWHM